MSLIEVRNLTHIYATKNEDGDIISQKTALDHLNFCAEEGEFVAILGANGSGKTTLARHLNALLLPTEGYVLIAGKSTTDPEELYAIRSTAGMVFQNPENQLVAQVLEDEVAFGPENLGLPAGEIRARVDDALRSVGLYERKNTLVEYLSGGQKQLAAIAGVLAMQPKCVVLDEATSMLDPQGRREVWDAIEKLRHEKHITIVMITHDVEEALMADRICVMDGGNLVLYGKPEDVFQREDEIRRYGLELPQAAEIARELRNGGIPIRQEILTEEELRRKLTRLTEERKNGELIRLTGEAKNGELNRLTVGEKRREFSQPSEGENSGERSQLPEEENSEGCSQLPEEENSGEFSLQLPEEENKGETLQLSREDNRPDLSYGGEVLALDHAAYRYFDGTSMQVTALKDISLSVHAGEFIAVIGQTGSGKSTLLDLLGGLIKPNEGTLRSNHRRIGIVFQYPDHQLFEETVLADVMFGPQNLGQDSKKAREQAVRALQVVRLPEETWERSPLSLSGGEKRKAALAGVLAMEPEILLLDEPTAGLAQADRTDLFSLLHEEYHKKGKTVLFTTHHMEDAAKFADRIIVLHRGEIAFDGAPGEVFRHCDELREIGLEVPLRIRLEEEYPIIFGKNLQG